MKLADSSLNVCLMKVSVAMCTHNGARFLQAQLDSIAAQTLQPDELVICDDASTDSTFNLIEDFAEAARFRVVKIRNSNTRGVVKNFEQALATSQGEIIALADQDDVWNRNKLEMIVSQFASDADTGMVFTDADVIDEKSDSLGYRLWEGKWIEFGPQEKELFKRNRGFELLLERNLVTGATMAFRSRFKPMIMPIPIDRRFLHDGWIAMLVSAVSQVAFVEQPLMKYRKHSNQQIGVNNESSPATDVAGRHALPGLVRGLAESSFASELVYLRSVVDRILASHEKVLYPDFDKVLDRLEHFEARSSLPLSRVRRISPVATEVFGGRYSRYSRGLWSAIKDVLFLN